MGKLIDAEALKKEIGRAPVWTALSVKEIIDEQADIVRCKECEFSWVFGTEHRLCDRLGEDNWVSVNADDFCSYGERSKQ